MKTITDQDRSAGAVKFLLKDPRADRPTLISLVHRYANTRFVYSTGLTIDPYQWDADNQRAYTNQKGRTGRETYQISTQDSTATGPPLKRR